MPRPNHLVLRLPRVDSTQTEARRWALEGCRSGTVVLAEEQTEGRGRRGRSWTSPPRLGLWMTTVHRTGRPAAEWPAMTMAGSLAVCLALETIGLSPQARWPNDVLLQGGKVAGILADTEGSAILLGIGINVLHEPADFPEDLRATATSIRIEQRRVRSRPEVDREAFLWLLLERQRDLLETFERDGPGAVVEAVWDRSLVRGRTVLVEPADREIVRGRVTGLGPVGELLVEGSGGVVAVVNGTIVRMEEV